MVRDSQMCLNGAVIHVLASSFGFPIGMGTLCNSVPWRSLDTSALLFTSWTAGEEFESDYCLIIV